MGNEHSAEPEIGGSAWVRPAHLVKEWLLPTTECSLNELRRCFEKYRNQVESNPLLVSEVESALYWISYLLASTRFHNSRVVSELLYSCSSLLSLFNDHLLRDAYGLHRSSNRAVRVLHTVLQFVEFVQVFVELAATRLYGQCGKWVVISIIEVMKASIRLLLLLRYQQGLTHRNYIRPLNRAKEMERHRLRTAASDKPPGTVRSDSFSSDEAIVLNEAVEEAGFQLQSSGRSIRDIEHSPARDQRTWMTPAQTDRMRRLLQKNHEHCPTVTQLNRRRMLGELLHIVRPVAYLGAGAVAGGFEDRWGPYLIALGLDVASLRLLSGSGHALDADNMLSVLHGDGAADQVWNWSERVEIQRRYLSLLMYLLRSPFYDRYTKQRLIRLLSVMADYIPLLGRLIRPLIGLLPEWQQLYFHVWNS